MGIYFLAYVGSNKVKLRPLHYVFPAKVKKTNPIIISATKVMTNNLVKLIIAFFEI